MSVSGSLRMALATTLALVATCGQSLAATAGELTADIDKFMAAHAREIEKRLGSGSRVEYSIPASVIGDRTCAVAPSITAREQSQTLNRVTLLVACGNEWSFYIPVALDVHRAVVIANKPLASGAVIGSDDVELSSLEVGQIGGTYLTTLEEAVGMRVKRPLAAGRPVLTHQLEQQVLIRRGDAVIISAETSALAVKMSGTALADGRRGEQIRIKNLTTSRIVDARVVGPGQVAVPM